MKVKIDPNKILNEVRELGFEEVWLRSAELLPSIGKGLMLTGRGTAHPVADLVEKLREAFLGMGFNEILLPTIVEENEVYKQYGPEAPIILDRCYYLATLPRPDIGLSREKCDRIRALGISLDERSIETIQKVLHDYKRGKVDADDLVERFMLSLRTTDANALRVLREVFPEFTTLKPAPSNLTLRSHLTSAWFDTLSILQHQTTHPLKLFSVGARYRREQSEDTTHLRAHVGASCVILDEEVTLDDGKKVAETLLGRFGLSELKFDQKKTTSKYYAPKTEYEVFANAPRVGKWIEVADLGFYSPIALAHYDIEFPVLNLGLGVERLAMLLNGTQDIRALAYPQFYGQWTLTDAELARMVRIEQGPKTTEGKTVCEAIVTTARAGAEQPSPCEVVAYKGKLLGQDVQVTVYEPDANTKLLGPAALNTIYVHNGNILGIPPTGLDDVKEVKEAREKGISTDITYLDAVAASAAASIESEASRGGIKDVELRVRIAKSPSDVNIVISNVANRYITGRQKKVVVKGPTFIGIRAHFFHP
jgi:O-phosphoseryl-tRNA synthetase